MDSITGAVENLHKIGERVGVIDMNAIELCLSYLIETCSELENNARQDRLTISELSDQLYELQAVR